jgi:hypothetical protein
MDKNKSFVQNMGTYSIDESIPVDYIIALNGMNVPEREEEPAGPQGINANCPSFIMCNSTNNRPYRVPMSDVYFTPTPQPLNWQQTKNASWQKTGCKCILNSSKTHANICYCKTSV